MVTNSFMAFMKELKKLRKSGLQRFFVFLRISLFKQFTLKKVPIYLKTRMKGNGEFIIVIRL